MFFVFRGQNDHSVAQAEWVLISGRARGTLKIEPFCRPRVSNGDPPPAFGHAGEHRGICSRGGAPRLFFTRCGPGSSLQEEDLPFWLRGTRTPPAPTVLVTVGTGGERVGYVSWRPSSVDLEASSFFEQPGLLSKKGGKICLLT